MTFKTPDELIMEIKAAARSFYSTEARRHGCISLMFIRERTYRRFYYRSVVAFEPWSGYAYNYWIDRRGNFYESSEIFWHPTTTVYGGFSWRSIDRQMDSDRALSCSRQMIDLRKLPHMKLDQLLAALTSTLEGQRSPT